MLSWDGPVERFLFWPLVVLVFQLLLFSDEVFSLSLSLMDPVSAVVSYVVAVELWSGEC